MSCYAYKINGIAMRTLMIIERNYTALKKCTHVGAGFEEFDLRFLS